MKFPISNLLIISIFFMFGGCGQTKVVYRPTTLPKPLPATTEVSERAPAAEKPGYEVLQSPSYDERPPAKPPVPVPAPVPVSETKIPPPPDAIDLKRIGVTKDAVVLNAENMPLSDFVIYALGETMKITFVMDEKVMSNKQPVTLRMPQATAPDMALEIVVGLLEKNGVQLEERAGALYILSKQPKPVPSPTTPPPSTEPYQVQIGRTVPDSQKDILQIVPLRHTSIPEIQQFVVDVSRAKVQLKANPRGGGNILMMYGQPAEIKKVLDTLEVLDVPYYESKKFLLLRFTYIQPEEFISTLKTIFAALDLRIATSPGGIGPLLVPIKALEGILLVSPDEKTTRYILEWKEKLDNAAAAGSEERAFTYKPQFSKATELVRSIQSLYGAVPAAAAGVSKAALAVGGSFLGGKIAADDIKNIVIVVSTPAVYKVILDLFKGLDTPPRQVLIEATIVELTLTDELKYGVEWFLKNSQLNGNYTLGTLGSLGLGGLGLSYSWTGNSGSFQALISAWAKLDRANILSTPRLMVMDNMTATIQVGSDIPTVTGEYTTANAAQGVMRNISYRNTGVMLSVKPTINSEGLLTLDISQEVSVPGASGAGSSPIILTRRINTTVSVRHGQTIALGGLIKDNSGVSEGKVPFLGDLPLIGNLFKYTSKTGEKTELLVLVTPTILSDKDDAQKITDELRKELKWFDIPDRKVPSMPLKEK